MRNILQYPITKEEIENCLITIADALLNPPGIDLPVGDMRPMLLYAAAKIVKDSGYPNE